MKTYTVPVQITHSIQVKADNEAEAMALAELHALMQFHEANQVEAQKPTDFMYEFEGATA